MQERNNKQASSAQAFDEAKILEMLAKRPFARRDLVERLKARGQEDALREQLKQMSRAGKLVEHRGMHWSTAGKEQVEGVVTLEPSGSIALMTVGADGESRRLPITPRGAKAMVPGDIASAYVIPPARPGQVDEAAVAKIISRPHPQLWARAGRDAESGELRLFSERRIEAQSFVPESAAGLAEGDIVLVKVLDRNFLGAKAKARVERKLGNERDNGIESKLAFELCAIPTGFSDEARAEAKGLRMPPRGDDPFREERLEVPFCTIDGESSRDFDDAVAGKLLADGSVELRVAIADVSHFVRPGSALDADARRKMTSTYLPHGVDPMLPEELSNGLCSLNPGEDRFALSAVIVIGADGEVKSEAFESILMRSQARLTYAKAADFLEGKADLDAPEAVKKSLLACEEAARRLRSGPLGAGRLDMGQDETEFKLGADGKIEKIESRPRESSSLLVEECMLAANRAAANALAGSGYFGIFRNHFAPTQEMVDELNEALEGYGHAVSAPEGQAPSSQDFAALIARAKADPRYAMIRSEILKRLAPAVYERENAGHFSLGMGAYTHFTSPIRRYPDLAAHRLIKAIAAGMDPSAQMGAEELAQVGQVATARGKKASEAENEARKLLRWEYANRLVGQEARAKITNLTNRGAWVELVGSRLEAFVPEKSIQGASFKEDKGRWIKDDGSELFPNEELAARIRSASSFSRRMEVAISTGATPALEAEDFRGGKPRGGRGPR